jgi:hypothetical protein
LGSVGRAFWVCGQRVAYGRPSVGAQAIAAFGVDVSRLHRTELAIMIFDHPLDPQFRLSIAVATAMDNRYVRS